MSTQVQTSDETSKLEKILENPKSLTKLSPEKFADVLKVMAEGASEATKDKVAGMLQSELEKSGSVATTALPVPPLTAQFEQVYAGQYSTVEMHLGKLGTREVQITLKGGAENLEPACSEINEAIKGARNYPSNDFKVYLSGNNDLPKGSADIVETYTAVIKDSGNRVRGEGNPDPDTSHEAFLKKLGLKFVNNDLHRLACGALRVREGFPEDVSKIGTSEDQGDLNEGLVVRTAKGARSGAVLSFDIGVYGFDWFDVNAVGYWVVAGASPRN